jgi:hypothetical protein
MPISKGRKSKPKLPATPAVRRTPFLSKNIPITQRRKLIRFGKFAEVVGAIASVLAIAGAIYDVMRGPDILSDSQPDVSSPFALPFYVSNNSFILRITKARMYCDIDILQANFSIIGVTLMGDPEADIPRRDTVGFRCPLGRHGQNIFKMQPNTRKIAHIFLRVTYRTLYIKRESDPIEFTWNAAIDPPRWVRGKLADPNSY